MRDYTIDLEKKQLSGYHLKEVLKICGHTLKEFTLVELDKSYQWARQTLGKYKVIPLKYYDKLVDFVTEENFNLAIDQIKEKQKLWNERREEKTND